MPQENKLEELPDELPRKKWWLPLLIGVLVVAALIYGGRKIYGRVEPERLSRRAKVLIEKGDYRGALITLSRALQINNNSRNATRTMVELMEKLNAPQATEWHRRLSELNPDSPEDAMAWAQYALKQGNSEVASQALDQLAPDSRTNAQFQTASGLTAVQSGNLKTARDFFGEAARMEPGSDVIRYNLALVQSQSSDAAERNAGWDSLTALSKGGRAQAFALRTLLTRFAREGKLQEAHTQSDALVKLPDAKFRDWLIHAELLRLLKNPEWTKALDRARTLAEDVPTDAAALVNWYRMNQKPEEGLQWVAKLDPAITDSPVVCAARAESLLVLKQWGPLMRITSLRGWPGLEHLRLAYLSRAQSQKGEQTAADGSWTDAVAACRGDRGRLVQVASLAASWRWIPQGREALWAATHAPSPDWALELLYQSYASEKNTTEMLAVARRMIEQHPEDLRAKNNVALFSLLVREDPREGLSISRDLVNQQPENPIFRSTYAFALLASGMPEECLAEMEKLSPNERKNPDYAPYFAFAYQANGDLAQVREFLVKVDRKKLLPEESMLVSRLEN